MGCRRHARTEDGAAWSDAPIDRPLIHVTGGRGCSCGSFCFAVEGTLLRVCRAGSVTPALAFATAAGNLPNNTSEETVAMERVQVHKFIDLSKPVDKKPDENTRRSFLAKVSGIAAITAMAPEAFARNFIDKYDPDGPIARYPNPDVIVLDKRFKYKLGNTPDRAPVSRHDVGGGPGVERRRPLPDLERHPEQRAAALDRGRRQRAPQFRYPSNNSNGNTFDYSGPAGRVRARHAARGPLRARRQLYRSSRTAPTARA